MPRDLTADMRAAVHRARLQYERSIGWHQALPAEAIDDEVARRVACPVQKGFDVADYAALLATGVPVDG